MNPARAELIEKVEDLLSAWKGAEEGIIGNFSGSLTPVLAERAFSTDALYRAMMHLADAFADAVTHGLSRVDDMDVATASTILETGLDALKKGYAEPPLELLAYV